MCDLDASVEYAKETGKGDVTRLGITGLLLGRTHRVAVCRAQQAAEGRRRLVRPPGRRASELFPKHPVNVAADLKAPVLGLYAGKDQGIPLDTVEQMREALKKAKVPAEIVVYPDAQHGFHADYRPMYKEDDAKDGWNRLLAWFKQHGAA